MSGSPNRERIDGPMRVVVTGASGAVGRHVADRLWASESVSELVALDRVAADGVRQFELLDDDLADVLMKGDILVHLAATPAGFAGDAGAARADRELAERVLAGAKNAQVDHVLLASSAMVYGAWPENPLPLTEAAPVKPNPEFRFGVVRGEIEALGEAWASETGAALTIVRAATTLARGRENGLANLLRHSAALRSSDGDAPAQFLHAEDFASAIELLVIGGHEGIYNVAADGWLRPAEIAALRGTPETPIRVPGVVISAVSDARRRLGAATHPGLTAYLQHPWVVATDKIKSLGWQPEFSNEEAYVAGHRASRFDGVTAKRRQELALGAAGATIATGVVGAAGAISWLLRRSRR
ncbi:MAG: NAD-dependent epimerase/dehydratase family protein [Acidimicrobiia bacterium]|nr:NAD-dependent epimerase/dehydratase family protein [Acidimicrobiia bacterium]